ncbi:MAG: TraR/DksA family transcriptional regulator [Aquificae bacterium]|nr:TraR/DksA family transcriptional regulator [Aquificota bacterium]
MDREQLYKECEKKLQEEREKIVKAYIHKQETQERISEDYKEPSDVEDLGQMTYTEELLDKLSQRDMFILREIDYALEKIKNGTYGICEGCGVEIPEERLCAIPWTRYCAKCAEEYEQLYGTYMEPSGFENYSDIRIEREDITEE